MQKSTLVAIATSVLGWAGTQPAFASPAALSNAGMGAFQPCETALTSVAATNSTAPILLADLGHATIIFPVARPSEHTEQKTERAIRTGAKAKTTARAALKGKTSPRMLRQTEHTSRGVLRGKVRLEGGQPAVKASVDPELATTIRQNLYVASKLMDRGLYAEAEKQYCDVLSLDPNNVDTLVGLGWARTRLFKLGSARQQFEKALGLDPNNAHAHAGLGTVAITLYQYSKDPAVKNQPQLLDQCEKHSRLAIKSDPHLAEAHFNLGQVYKHRGAIAQSVEALKKALHGNPSDVQVLCDLGMLELEQGLLGQAADRFEKAAGLRPDSATAHYGLAKVLLRQERLAEAVTELQTSVNLYPQSWQVRQDLADACLRQGRFDLAVREYQEILSLRQADVQAYLRIADVANMAGDASVRRWSLEALYQGLKQFPESVPLRIAAAEQHIALQQIDAALAEYWTALKQDNSNPRVIRGITRCHYLACLGKGVLDVPSANFEKAADAVEQAWNDNPQDKLLQISRAEMQSLAGQAPDVGSLRNGLQSAEERVAYVEALLAQCKYADAQKEVDTFLCNDASPESTLWTGDQLFFSRHLTGAESAYQKAAMSSPFKSRATESLKQVRAEREAARVARAAAARLSKDKKHVQAIDNYRRAIYQDPSVPEAHLELARLAEKIKPASRASLTESSLHYRAYMALNAGISPRERESIQKRSEDLDRRSAKLGQGLPRAPWIVALAD